MATDKIGIFSRIDSNIYCNPKFKEASFYAKKDGYDINYIQFITLFTFYIFENSLTDFSNQDVRCINKFKLLEGGWTPESITLFNDYLLKVKLLDKKYRVSNWHKWNGWANKNNEGLKNSAPLSGGSAGGQRPSAPLSAPQRGVSVSILKKKMRDRKSHLKNRLLYSEGQINQDQTILLLNAQISQILTENSAPLSGGSAGGQRPSAPLSPPIELDKELEHSSNSYSAKVIDNDEMIININNTIKPQNKASAKKQTIKLLNFNDQSKEEIREWFGERTYWIFLSSTLNAIKDTVSDQTTIDGIETLKNEIGYSKEAYSEIYDVIIKEGISKVSCSPLELIKNGFLGAYFYIRQCEAIKRKGVWIKAAQYFTKKTNNNLNNLYEALEYTGIQKILSLCKDEGLFRITEEGGLYHDRNKVEFQQKKRRR